MGYAFQQFFWSVAGEFIVAAISGVVVMIWGRYEGSGRWYAAIGGTVFTAAIFIMLNQAGWWEPPVEVKIHQWLDDASWSIRKIPKTDSGDLEFGFEVKIPKGAVQQSDMTFYISRPTHTGNGFIVLEAGYDVQGSFPGFNHLGASDRQQLYRKLTSDLAMIGTGYTFNKDGSIRLNYHIGASSITQEELFRGLSRIGSAMTIATNQIGLTLKE
jgi:hypothetical protein